MSPSAEDRAFPCNCLHFMIFSVSHMSALSDRIGLVEQCSTASRSNDEPRSKRLHHTRQLLPTCTRYTPIFGHYRYRLCDHESCWNRVTCDDTHVRVMYCCSGAFYSAFRRVLFSFLVSCIHSSFLFLRTGICRCSRGGNETPLAGCSSSGAVCSVRVGRRD